jgi:hypothetical protein
MSHAYGITPHEPRCEKTDLITSQCAHCTGHLDLDTQVHAERAALIASGRWFPSKYPGKCARCGDWFGEGAAIRGVDGQPGWIAECCADPTKEKHTHG